MKLKFGVLALGMALSSCGPQGIWDWTVTIDQDNNDPSKWPASCFPGEPGAVASARVNNGNTFGTFRDPARWATYQVKDKQFMLQLDAGTAAWIAGLMGAAVDSSVPAADVRVIEGTDGKSFTSTYTNLANAGVEGAPQVTYTATATINWTNQDPATGGTIAITTNRTCTGGASGACMSLPDIACAIPTFNFLARRVGTVEGGALVAGDQ